MREFILLARKGLTKPFSLKDLPGAGRIDLVARCISSAVFISHAIRKDVIFHAVLYGPPEPPKTISFYAKKLRAVSPDERNIASHLNIALRKSDELKKDEILETEPGITISKKSFEQLVEEKLEAGKQVIYMHPAGKDLKKFKLSTDWVALLGDHLGLPKKIEKFLKNCKVERISVGRLEYLASQVITIIHYELDRRGSCFSRG